MSLDKVGAVLVIGGGISGMQSALDLADSGFKVYVLDKSPCIGGAMSQLDKTFPTNDCSMCIMAPKLVETGRHQNIDLITNANLEKVEGDAGNFTIHITKKPRYVDESRCTGCGICTQRCPIEVPDDYNKRLKKRKAIHVKYPQAVPPFHNIDQEVCIGCGICETQCEAEAIRYSQDAYPITLNVGSIIISPGFDEFDLHIKRKEYGWGKYPNVISSLQMERMLSATGPYGGMVLRPSDGEMVKKVAFVQCVGSRDRSIGKPYCSSVCCMFAIKEAVLAQEHNPGLRSTIFFMDMRAFGKEFDDYYIKAAKEHKVRFVSNNRISSIKEIPESHNLKLMYIEDGELKEEEYDMVVLSVGMDSPEGARQLSEKIGFELNDFNFSETSIFSPESTDKTGIYVSGVFQGPKDIPDSVAQASGAAFLAQKLIQEKRDTLTTIKEYPQEKDVEGQNPRIGAFICECGINIGGVVNVPDVVEYTKTLPNVVFAEHNMYTCSQDTQEHIKEMIREHNLNRVLVASCTPRTHQPLFQNTVAEAGLNPYLFEMANIRDQCSWVHINEPEKATAKAKDLVRMGLAKASLNSSLPKLLIDVKQSALVLGGGLSGLCASKELAEMGYETFLVEKENELGGIVRRVHYGLRGEDIQGFLDDIIDSVESNDKITIFKNAELTNLSGHVGNFESTIKHNMEEKKLEHGVVIVATGGKEYRPGEYLYGKNEKVLTQLEFDNILFNNDLDPKTRSIVMIQCVGCRDENRTYCSRVCCTQAVKNALKVKEKNPDAAIYILFKDMRTYSFREIYYEDAARSGVVFIRYDDESKPEVNEKDGMEVVTFDPFLNEKIILKPDYVVLSAATVPNPDNANLAHLLKVPLSKDGFFLEAHMKLRPVEFATDGIFLCGLAHSPKFFEECVSQASAAVSRASTILSKKTLESEGIVSSIDPEVCSGCGTCIAICPFNAISKDENGLAEVTAVLCKGCGTCSASCPEKAATIMQFTDEQLIAQVSAAVRGVQ